MRTPKTCICGHNKKAHSYYYGCNRCSCQKFSSNTHPAYRKLVDKAIKRMEARMKVGEL